ncbi:MAG: UDP-N-acetylglucosamine acyltransferase [Pusillimonas sp.]|nr:UDP-N-acetylglucosamine acyltransferase [Pusillimonas sp.]MBC40665.1 UDP-N-acetylglucosamine acyltransferase [Pusillimonas sp.]HCP77732.1 UDP-N-acetylglucosamine acyltransferase [Pusillimonas sp.]
MRRLIVTVAFMMTLAGCQSLPPVNFAVPNVGFSENKVDAELRSITVSLASPEEKKGDLPAGAEVAAPMWRAALQEALNRMAIFQDDADTKVNLSVKVLALDMPSFGASMTTTSIARYEIIDRSNGDIIYTEEIAADGVVPFDHAFIGAVRARESLNRSVQQNIAQFLQALETVDVAKPMFPAEAPNASD